MKKILICYASIGSGHRIAAEAIQEALGPVAHVDVKLVDVFAPLQGSRRKITELASLVSMWIAPQLYTRAWNSELLSGLSAKLPAPQHLRRYLMSIYRDYRPDLILCTHALPCTIFGKEAAGAVVTAPIIAVATDFQVHPYWPLASIHHFIVGSEIARDQLRQWGMAANWISVLGIPIRQQFVETMAESQREKDTTQAHRVLMLAGGKASAPHATVWRAVISMIRRLGCLRIPCSQWTVVTGNNGWLKRLLTWIARDNPQVTVVGYVHDMATLLAKSDVILTKPGGLTLTECLALHKPIVLLTRGAGQEAANTQYLLNRGAAILCEDPTQTAELVERILLNGEARELAQNAATLAYPHAADQIANYLLKLLGVGDLSMNGDLREILGPRPSSRFFAEDHAAHGVLKVGIGQPDRCAAEECAGEGAQPPIAGAQPKQLGAPVQGNGDQKERVNFQTRRLDAMPQ
ncbi:MAG: glycosyltransferase [Caldilineaceae bacterium]|nr:glycosyltransferase [Caldilineaceae bacterium]